MTLSIQEKKERLGASLQMNMNTKRAKTDVCLLRLPNCLRIPWLLRSFLKTNTVWPGKGGGGGGGGGTPNILLAVCGPLIKTLTALQIRVCDFLFL